MSSVRRLQEIDDGQFPLEVKDYLVRKAGQMREEKEWKPAPWLTSEQLMDNASRLYDKMIEFDLNGDMGTKLLTNVNKMALNVGVMPQYIGTTDDPTTDPIFKGILDKITGDLVRNARTYYKHSGSNIDVKFNRTSSVGIVGGKQHPLEQYNCTHDIEAKYDIIKFIANCDVKDISKLETIIVRSQLDKAAKSDKRAAQLIKGLDECYNGLVHNPYHGQRVRLAISDPWSTNTQMVALNTLYMDSLPDWIKPVWKFTNESIIDRTMGKVILTYDVTNNDSSFNIHMNRYIHKQIMSDEMFQLWDDMNNHATIYGVYRDELDRNVFYRLTDWPLGMRSGEGFTSLVNKIGHTARSLYHVLKALRVANNTTYDSLEDEILAASKYVVNNGDDILLIFEPSQLSLMRAVEKRFSDDTLQIYEKQAGQFSGLDFVQREVSLVVYKVGISLMTLFKGSMERERRSYNSILGTLPLNSMLGRLELVETYGMDDDITISDATEVYFDLMGFAGSRAELVDLAKSELDEFTSKNGDRAAAIYEIAKKMGVRDPSQLWWRFTAKEIFDVVGGLIDALFLRVPIDTVLRPKSVEFLRCNKSKTK